MMPSKAFNDHLLVLLQDADELLDIHLKLRTGRPGRQWGLGSLNQAVVFLCVSSWEAYVEQLVLEAVASLRPPAGTPPGTWPALNGLTASSVKQFHTPNVDKVRKLMSDFIGMQDVTTCWHWKNCNAAHARKLLGKALEFRHQIAHGVNSRPVIGSPYATQLVGFFRRLGKWTDDGIREYLVRTLGVASPWPP